MVNLNPSLESVVGTLTFAEFRALYLLDLHGSMTKAAAESNLPLSTLRGQIERLNKELPRLTGQEPCQKVRGRWVLTPAGRIVAARYPALEALLEEMMRETKEPHLIVRIPCTTDGIEELVELQAKAHDIAAELVPFPVRTTDFRDTLRDPARRFPLAFGSALLDSGSENVDAQTVVIARLRRPLKFVTRSDVRLPSPTSVTSLLRRPDLRFLVPRRGVVADYLRENAPQDWNPDLERFVIVPDLEFAVRSLRTDAAGTAGMFVHGIEDRLLDEDDVDHVPGLRLIDLVEAGASHEAVTGCFYNSAAAKALGDAERSIYEELWLLVQKEHHKSDSRGAASRSGRQATRSAS